MKDKIFNVESISQELETNPKKEIRIVSANPPTDKKNGKVTPEELEAMTNPNEEFSRTGGLIPYEGEELVYYRRK